MNGMKRLSALCEVYSNKTNLAPDSSYYKVKSPFTIWVIAGFVKSNHYYGSSQLFAPKYARTVVAKGDEIHNIPGGLFWVDFASGVGHPFDTEQREFSPFEKGGTYYSFDLSKLEKIEKAQAIRANYEVVR